MESFPRTGAWGTDGVNAFLRDNPARGCPAANQLAFARPATNEETTGALEFIEQLNQTEEPKAEGDSIGWTSFCQALFASAEFRYLR